MKLLLILLLCLSTYGQANAPVVRVPDQQARQLKQLDEWINAKAAEYQTQRLIVTQRTCLELGYDAKRCDASEFVEEGGVWIVRPKLEPKK